MRPSLAALTALLLAVPSGAFVCSEGTRRRPVVRVAASRFPTVVEHRKSLKEIGRLHHVKRPEGLFSQALTVADYRIRYSADLEGACDKDCAKACAWIGALTVDLTPASLRVYIPKEYPEGSCEYMALMRHEGEHDRLHRVRLGELEWKLRAALTAAQARPELLGPVEGRDRKDAFALLTERMERLMRPIYDRHLAELRAEHEALDSTEEYRRLGGLCGGWRRRR